MGKVDKNEKFYEVTIKQYYMVPKDLTDEQFRSWFDEFNLNRDHASRHFYEIGYTKTLESIGNITFEAYRKTREKERQKLIKRIKREEKEKEIENKRIEEMRKCWEGEENE